LQSKEVRSKAAQSYSISPRIYRTVLVQQQGSVSQGNKLQGSARQSYSVRAKSFTEPFWFKATQGRESRRKEGKGNKKQRDKVSALSGRFDHPAGIHRLFY
jgi:hypothetical protein